MRIAIADFETMGGDLGFKDVGSIVAEWLITSFVQSGRYEVVERSLSYRRSWKSRSWLFPAWWRKKARSNWQGLRSEGHHLGDLDQDEGHH